MRYIKKALMLFLAASMLLSCITVSHAAETDCPSKAFTDVPPEGHWAHGGIDYMIENGYMNGTSATEKVFSPDMTTSRAMIVQILYAMEGKPEVEGDMKFADVPANAWFYDAVLWATENDVANGVSDTRFDPNGDVTREQIGTFLCRYVIAGTEDDLAALEKFPDAAAVSSWAGIATGWAVGKGVITGKSRNGETFLDPQAKATRAEVATMFARFAGLGPDACRHQYEPSVTAPTCTEPGFTAYTCSRCENTYTGDETEALGHDYKSVVTEPTCTEPGFTTYTCSRCENSYTGKETEALGHDYADGVCTRCGEADPDYHAEPNWVSTWATAEENFVASTDRVPNPLNGTTVRQIIRVTTSGETMKLKFSNQYGKSDVVVRSLHIAKQVQADKSTIDVSTDTVVTVGGQEEFIIPAGKTIETDPVEFPVNALDNVAVSMYFGSAPTTAQELTGHRGARATTYQISGNKVSTATFSNPKTILSWYFLCDVALDMPTGSRAIVCFGDSITDGYGTDASYLGPKPDQYTRWGDYFAKRLQADENTKNVSILNEGIGSNGILGSWPTDAGKDRYARDLLEHDGVEYVIILMGVNDLQKLNNTSKFAQLKAEYEKMIRLAHDNGIKVYAAPILPFGKYSDYYSAGSEQVRTMINDWFRSEESNVDGIIDFETPLVDPSDPKCILPRYTSDGLHPDKAYDIMANAIDLKLFY